jgi:hypothetical protein
MIQCNRKFLLTISTNAVSDYSKVFRRRLGFFVFTTASRTVLGPTQPPIQWVPGALSLGVRQVAREADHSPPSSVEVKEWVELYLHSPIRLHGVVLYLSDIISSFHTVDLMWLLAYKRCDIFRTECVACLLSITLYEEESKSNLNIFFTNNMYK